MNNNRVNICCLYQGIMGLNKYEIKSNKNDWYDRVYLCWEDTDFNKPTTYKPIKGFNCYRYDSFESADYARDKHRDIEQKLVIRHTMIPMCKWVPKIFDKYILNLKLKNIYWLGKISIVSSYKFKK